MFSAPTVPKPNLETEGKLGYLPPRLVGITGYFPRLLASLLLSLLLFHPESSKGAVLRDEHVEKDYRLNQKIPF